MLQDGRFSPLLRVSGEPPSGGGAPGSGTAELTAPLLQFPCGLIRGARGRAAASPATHAARGRCAREPASVRAARHSI